jgi:hypothetical protein
LALISLTFMALAGIGLCHRRPFWRRFDFGGRAAGIPGENSGARIPGQEFRAKVFWAIVFWERALAMTSREMRQRR